MCTVLINHHLTSINHADGPLITRVEDLIEEVIGSHSGGTGEVMMTDETTPQSPESEVVLQPHYESTVAQLCQDITSGTELCALDLEEERGRLKPSTQLPVAAKW